MSDPEHNLFSPRFSPDNRWIALHEATGPWTRRLIIVRFKGDVTHENNEWIPVSDGAAYDVEPRWSPDGNLLFFISQRDGYRCIWGTAFGAYNKTSVGPPFPVQHFHVAMRDPIGIDPAAIGLSVAQ
jgi:Tol biopolymer transport system component